MMFGLNGNANIYELLVATLLVLLVSTNGQLEPYGQTHVVEAKGEHKATVVWLHGLTENGFRWSNVLRLLGCESIKFIVPTAPFRRISAWGGVPTTAWFDIGAITPSGFTDTAGLDRTIKHAADLLANEPPNIPVAIGGFSLGSATTLYATAIYAKGSYTDGSPFNVNLTAAVALSGWLPGFAYLWNGKFDSPDAKARASSLPIFQAHGNLDPIVPYLVGLTSNNAQKRMGFSNLEFKTHPGRGHLYYPGELQEMCSYYQSKFGLK